jgi:hypothetical protein
VLTLADSDVRFFADLRAREFNRLDKQRLAYLDYTGSALYGSSQIRAHQQMLEQGLFGNPHSEHSASIASTDAIEGARERVLDFFGVTTATHAVCFTANATAAIGLVASGYPFSPRHALVLSADNHNSVNGIREYATRAGARVEYLALDRELRLDDGSGALRRMAPDSLPSRRNRTSRVFATRSRSSATRRSSASTSCSMRRRLRRRHPWTCGRRLPTSRWSRSTSCSGFPPGSAR